MHVSVEQTSTLGRRMNVAVPANELDQAVEQRLQSLAQNMRINGFRPGKVPVRVVRQRHGEQVRLEVVNELLQSSLARALSEQELRPAGPPRIDAGSDLPGTGQDLAYVADFDVYPDIELADLSAERLVLPELALDESDVEDMLERIRKQNADWSEVERPAADGDRVTIDFAGKVDGEAFEGGTGEDMAVELGGGQLIPGFEEQLAGVSPGESRTLEVTFPDDYPAENLAGKAAQFDITAKRVEESQVPALDDALAEKLGVTEGGLEALRERVRDNMRRQADSALSRRRKDAVMELLASRHEFDLPQALVEQEANKLAHDAHSGQDHEHEHDHGHHHHDIEPHLDEARRRVRLGLLLAEIVRRHELKADPARVRAEIEKLAAPFGEKEQQEQVVNWYYSQQDRLAEIEVMVLEDNVVDWVIEQAQTETAPVNFQELLGG